MKWQVAHVRTPEHGTGHDKVGPPTVIKLIVTDVMAAISRPLPRVSCNPMKCYKRMLAADVVSLLHTRQ